MPATDYLIMNAAKYPDDIALVEVNPAIRDERGKTWRDYELVEATPSQRYRREISWRYSTIKRTVSPTCCSMLA